MKFQAFDLFRNDYGQHFFEGHRLQPGVSKLKLVSTHFSESQRGRFFNRTVPDIKTEAEQTRFALFSHVDSVIEARSPAEIHQAAQNLARFNKAHPYLKPLPHPAVAGSRSARAAVEQLTYEFGASAKAYQAQLEAHSVDVEDWRPIDHDLGFVSFKRRLLAVIDTDVSRLEGKYEHLNIVVEASMVVAQGAEARSTSTRDFSAEEVNALRGLHREVKRSLSIANADLATIQGLYHRTQAAVMKFDALKPLGVEAGAKGSVRVSNFLSAGELLAVGPHQIKELGRMTTHYLKALGSLEEQVLRRKISKLAMTEALLLRVIRSAHTSTFADMALFRNLGNMHVA